MKPDRTMYLLAAGFFIVIAGSLAFPQSGSVTVPFTLEITANWEQGHVGQWDFANTAEKTAKAGAVIVIGIRKTNQTHHEIARLTDIGGPYGYEYDVRDSGGNSVKPKSPYDHNGWIKLGGPGRLRGTKDMVLEPGEANVSSPPISNWCDMSQPGKYTIQVSEHVSNDPQSNVIKSNVITIDIVPSDAPTPTQ